MIPAPKSTPNRLIVPYNKEARRYYTSDITPASLKKVKLTMEEIEDISNKATEMRKEANPKYKKIIPIFVALLIPAICLIIYTSVTGNEKTILPLIISLVVLFIIFGIVMFTYQFNPEKFEKTLQEYFDQINAEEYGEIGLNLKSGVQGCWIEFRFSWKPRKSGEGRQVVGQQAIGSEKNSEEDYHFSHGISQTLNSTVDSDDC